MCRPTTDGANRRRRASILLTTESFSFDDEKDRKDGGGAGGKNGGGGPAPDVSSTLLTTAVLCGVLLAIEMGMRWVLERYQDAHPVLESATNRSILARHVGVDALSCFAVAYIGLKNRHILSDLYDAVVHKADSMPPAGYEKRLFTYIPAGQHVLTFFFAYQVKNFVDTILWNDGIVYVMHHVFSGAAAWGGMHPGTSHSYAIFFMGISEMSTAVLCLLANFDDEHGAVGLGDAFPNAKAALGGLFVVLFVLCRCVMWPYASYYYVRDARLALKGNSDMMVGPRKFWVRVGMWSCIGLTFIQCIFLGMIVVTAKEEISKFL